MQKEQHLSRSVSGHCYVCSLRVCDDTALVYDLIEDLAHESEVGAGTIIVHQIVSISGDSGSRCQLEMFLRQQVHNSVM